MTNGIESRSTISPRDLFIENLVYQQTDEQQPFKTRLGTRSMISPHDLTLIVLLGNQSLLEQILLDRLQHEPVITDDENWFQSVINTVDHLFSLLYVSSLRHASHPKPCPYTLRWPSHEFVVTYLPGRHQWAILDQYCSRLHWFKELNSAR